MSSEGSRESCNLRTVFGVESIRENKLGCIYCTILLWHHACTMSKNSTRDFTSTGVVEDQMQDRINLASGKPSNIDNPTDASPYERG
jgi:recombinational DNA repair protein RecR